MNRRAPPHQPPIKGINFDVVRPHARIGVQAWAGFAAALLCLRLRRMSVQQVEFAQAKTDPVAHLLPLRS